jgi:hypothetical protein
MRKKLFKGFVTIVVVTVLSINLNFANADQGKETEGTQNSGLSVEVADPCNGSLCWQWCSLAFMHFCQLKCMDNTLICPQMTWPE